MNSEEKVNKVQQTSFYVYEKARNLSNHDKLVPMFDFADLKIYLFQIVVSAFDCVLLPILCDEAMFVIVPYP